MDVVYGEANSEFAVAWLSRVPVARAENHRLPQLEKTLLEIEVHGRRLSTTHLSAGRTRADEPRRVAEVEAILPHAGDVLVGDFNAVHPDGRDRSTAARGAGAGGTTCRAGRSSSSSKPDSPTAYERSTRRARLDVPRVASVARLDYVFARQRARACTVVETRASDHFAVVAELD
jgi:endonuclease/exonuclease/phosphatase family metal-dependent hydrolase